MRYSMLVAGMGAAMLAASCTESPETPLVSAAARNDPAELRQLIDSGHFVDEVGANGNTALVAAARSGALDAMRTLLDAGADPNRRDSRRTQWPPLLHAIHAYQRSAAALLLVRGADPNLGTEGGLTPLMIAAGDPDAELVVLLLTKGANPRVMGEYGDTPLVRAVSGGALTDIDRPLLGGCRTEIVRALLAHDPDLRLPANFNGRLALAWARLHGCRDVLMLLGT